MNLTDICSPPFSLQSGILFVALPEQKRNENSSLWKWILNKENQFNHFDMELKEQFSYGCSVSYSKSSW